MYEVPEHADVRLNTAALTTEESAHVVIQHLEHVGLLG